MNETKKRLQKVFTLHYWRFFFGFKYLFFVILFYYDMLIISSLGGGGGLERQGGYREWKTEIQSYTTVYELACAYSTPGVAFVKETFAKSPLFGTPSHALSNRLRFCFSSSCIRGKKTRHKLMSACQFPHTRQVD